MRSCRKNLLDSGRTSQEVRELKFLCRFPVGAEHRRTSQEVRELKSLSSGQLFVLHVAPRKRCVS